MTDKLFKLMFYVLRFYLESKIPQALSSYKQKFYCWTPAPTQALAFATKVGSETAVSDIRQYSTTAEHHRFVVAHVSEVPIGNYQDSSIQGFLAW